MPNSIPNPEWLEMAAGTIGELSNEVSALSVDFAGRMIAENELPATDEATTTFVAWINNQVVPRSDEKSDSAGQELRQFGLDLSRAAAMIRENDANAEEALVRALSDSSASPTEPAPAGRPRGPH